MSQQIYSKADIGSSQQKIDRIQKAMVEKMVLTPQQRIKTKQLVEKFKSSFKAKTNSTEWEDVGSSVADGFNALDKVLRADGDELVIAQGVMEMGTSIISTLVACGSQSALLGPAGAALAVVSGVLSLFMKPEKSQSEIILDGVRDIMQEYDLKDKSENIEKKKESLQLWEEKLVWVYKQVLDLKQGQFIDSNVILELWRDFAGPIVTHTDYVVLGNHLDDIPNKDADKHKHCKNPGVHEKLDVAYKRARHIMMYARLIHCRLKLSSNMLGFLNYLVQEKKINEEDQSDLTYKLIESWMHTLQLVVPRIKDSIADSPLNQLTENHIAWWIPTIAVLKSRDDYCVLTQVMRLGGLEPNPSPHYQFAVNGKNGQKIPSGVFGNFSVHKPENGPKPLSLRYSANDLKQKDTQIKECEMLSAPQWQEGTFRMSFLDTVTSKPKPHTTNFFLQLVKLKNNKDDFEFIAVYYKDGWYFLTTKNAVIEAIKDQKTLPVIHYFRGKKLGSMLHKGDILGKDSHWAFKQKQESVPIKDGIYKQTIKL